MEGLLRDYAKREHAERKKNEFEKFFRTSFLRHRSTPVGHFGGRGVGER